MGLDRNRVGLRRNRMGLDENHGMQLYAAMVNDSLF